MGFYECVMFCAGIPELVAEFDRLTGHSLSAMKTRTPMDAMIDEATGAERAACIDFLNFVWDCIYTRIPITST